MNKNVIHDLSELRSRFSIFDENEKHFYSSLSIAIKAVKEQRAKGRWVCGEPCPICGEDRYKGLDADIYADWQPNFCPNCGCRMVEPQESEDKE